MLVCKLHSAQVRRTQETLFFDFPRLADLQIFSASPLPSLFLQARTTVERMKRPERARPLVHVVISNPGNWQVAT